MFYTIYYINLNNVDFSELLKQLHKLGFPESYLNDFGFCPYLIIHKDFETNTKPVYDNINGGYLNSIKSKCIVIEDTTISDFIEHAKELCNKNKIGLF